MLDVVNRIADSDLSDKRNLSGRALQLARAQPF